VTEQQMSLFPEYGQWEYPARLMRVVDGDTYDLMIHLGPVLSPVMMSHWTAVLSGEVDYGFRIYLTEAGELVMVDRFRHASVDTWEMRGPNRDKGRAAKEAAEAWFTKRALSRWPFVARTSKDKRGKYGRWLVEVTALSDGSVLGDYLVSVGAEKQK